MSSDEEQYLENDIEAQKALQKQKTKNKKKKSRIEAARCQKYQELATLKRPKRHFNNE
jgi:hypothetical protein